MNFADELATFQARTADPGYSALIVLGTRQATTAALLIGTLSLSHVAFLLTDATRDLPQQVATLLNCSAEDWLCLPGDHSATLSVYQGMRRLMERWADLPRATIAVDVTGGLKPMSVGVEKAAHLLELATLYIESDYGPGPDGRFAPIPGTQRLILPPNPYLVFGDLEAAEARRLFSGHYYADAQRLYATLAARVPPPDSARYAVYAKLSSVYAAWDAFDLPGARETLRQLAATDAPETSLLQRHAMRLGFQSNVLAQMKEAQGPMSETPFDILAGNLDVVLAFLGSLYANAMRREAQGRYDFAALLLYRCLELMSQRRLALRGVDADARHITLMKGYGMLESASDQLVWSPAGSTHGKPRLLERIRRTTTARNKSLLAHGFRLIDYDSVYLPFRAVVDDVLDRFFAAEQVPASLGLVRAAWHALFEAPELE